MTNENQLNTHTDTPEVDKQVVILAGGVSDKEKFPAEVEKLMQEKAKQAFDIKKSTHTDLMNLLTQPYENRDMPSTQIDDAFRVISGYGDLKNMPNRFFITQEQINDLIYEMLTSTQKNLPDGITAEDVANIGEQSIKNFHEILQSVNTTKETYEEKIEDVRVF
jgi:hypothetical protein